MKFELLRQSHRNALLEFEKRNRRFFENVIAPRDAAFYSDEGVASHIDQLNSGSNLAFVLTNNSRVIARANLKNIVPNQSAEIGYRVGQDSTKHGVGSGCVRFLIEQARARQLKTLYAFVIDNNKASEKVLIKSGFSLHSRLPNEFKHLGQQLDGLKYMQKLAKL